MDNERLSQSRSLDARPHSRDEDAGISGTLPITHPIRDDERSTSSANSSTDSIKSIVFEHTDTLRKIGPPPNTSGNDDLAGDKIEPRRKEPERITIHQLRKTYGEVCKAVAEIELSASTLRTNSRALTLAKKLVNEIAFDMFKVLEDFRPRPRPEIPEEIGARFNEWAGSMGEEWKINIDHARQDFFIFTSVLSIERARARAREYEQSRADVWEQARVDAWEREKEGEGAADQAELWKTARHRRGFYYGMEETEPAFCSIPRNRMTMMTYEVRRFLRQEWEQDWDRAWAWEQKRKFESEPPVRLSTVPKDEWPSTKRVEDEHDWMQKDQKTYPGSWESKEGRLLQFWWNEVRKWRKRKENNLQLVNAFADACIDLMSELEKIDGTASMDDLNIFTPEVEDRYSVRTGRFHLKLIMAFRDEDQFMRHCDGLFKIIEKKLRSNSLKQGLDALIRKQDHFRNTFMDFAALAIFFSSITATTLQFSFAAADQSVLSTTVNLCWFASLVLSIASATNSFLGAIVHQSPEYLRPSASLNFSFLQAWFKFIPPALLSISGLLFLIGVCAFTFLSTSSFPNQGSVVKHVTVILTSTNVLALLITFLLAFTKSMPTIIQLICIPPAQIAIVLAFIVIDTLFHASHILWGLVRYGTYSSDDFYWSHVAHDKMRDFMYPTVRWSVEGLKERFDLHDPLQKLMKFLGDLWVKLKTFARRSATSDRTNTPLA